MTGELPKWQQDLTKVIMPGADMGQYMRIRMFLAANAELEGLHQAKLFEALDLVARVFDKIGNDDA